MRACCGGGSSAQVLTYYLLLSKYSKKGFRQKNADKKGCCVRACGARPRAGLLRAPACGRRRCRLPPSPRRVPSVAGRSGAGGAAVRRGSARDAQAARFWDPDARGAWTCAVRGPETVEKSNRGAPPPPIHTAPRFCVLPVLLPFLAGTAQSRAVENGSCRVQARNWQKRSPNFALFRILVQNGVLASRKRRFGTAASRLAE